MAKKGNSTDTPKKAANRAKSAPLSNSAIRFLGFLVAFLGIMLIMSKDQIIGIVLNVLAIFLILWGLFLVSSGFKKLKGNQGNQFLNIFLGLLMMVAGVLLLVFGGNIQKWFLIVIGAFIGVYGLMMLIKFICAASSRKTTFNIVMSIFTIITGILVCLLYVPQIKGAAGGICYTIFGAVATTVGAIEIIFY